MLDNLLFKYRTPLAFILIALLLIGFGVFYTKNIKNDKIEIPGVYKLKTDQRVEDALVLAGGLSADADRSWVEKYLNRAAKLVDGQKIFIPEKGNDSQTLGATAKNNGIYQTVSGEVSSYNSGLVNINTSDAKTLESLPGI